MLDLQLPEFPLTSTAQAQLTGVGSPDDNGFVVRPMWRIVYRHSTLYLQFEPELAMPSVVMRNLDEMAYRIGEAKEASATGIITLNRDMAAMIAAPGTFVVVHDKLHERCVSAAA